MPAVVLRTERRPNECTVLLSVCVVGMLTFCCTRTNKIVGWFCLLICILQLHHLIPSRAAPGDANPCSHLMSVPAVPSLLLSLHCSSRAWQAATLGRRILCLGESPSRSTERSKQIAADQHLNPSFTPPASPPSTSHCLPSRSLRDPSVDSVPASLISYQHSRPERSHHFPILISASTTGEL